MVFFRTLIKNIATNPLRKWKYNYKHLVKLICVSQAVIDVLKPAIKDHARFSIVGSATDLDDFKNHTKTYKLHDELGLPHNTQLIANISETNLISRNWLIRLCFAANIFSLRFLFCWLFLVCMLILCKSNQN